VFEYYHPSAKRNIKRHFKGQMLEKVLNFEGYHIVTLCDKNHKQHQCKVHRLVAEAWIPNPQNKKEVGHLKTMPNGLEDKTANEVWNLQWMTREENGNYGTLPQRLTGIQNGRQLNRPDASKKVLQFDLEWNFIKEYPSASEAGRQLNCHWDTIAKVCRGDRNKALNFYWKYGN
jgi:hypothetical protein